MSTCTPTLSPRLNLASPCPPFQSPSTFRVPSAAKNPYPGPGFRVQDFGFWVSGSMVQGFGFWASGSGFQVQGFVVRFRVEVRGFRVSGVPPRLFPRYVSTSTSGAATPTRHWSRPCTCFRALYKLFIMYYSFDSFMTIYHVSLFIHYFLLFSMMGFRFFGFQVSGSEFRVSGAGFRVPSSGFRVSGEGFGEPRTP